MLANRSSVFLFISFGVFLTSTLASVLSLTCSNWSFNPLNDVALNQVAVSQNSAVKAQKVLGISVDKSSEPGENKSVNTTSPLVTKSININENNSYAVGKIIHNNQEKRSQHESQNKGVLRIIETTSSSALNLKDALSLQKLTISIDSDKYSCQILLSFDNGKTWVRWENNAWVTSKASSIENFEGMDEKILEELSAKEYLSTNGFMPGVTESVNFKIILYSQGTSDAPVHFTAEYYNVS